jgi:glucokinase
MYYLGIDIGGTTVKAGLVDETGKILESTRVPTVIDDLNAFLVTLTELIRSYQRLHDIGGVGIGVPGLRNARTHVIRTSPNIPCLRNVSLEKLLADQVHVPIITENDANVAAYAEFRCGMGKGLQHMAFLTLGTGLGSGLILNGRLFGGYSGYAAEFGHTVIEPGGRPCGCGNKGCLETIVSAQGILLTALEMIADAPGSVLHTVAQPLSSELIHRAAVAGDTTAKAVFEKTGRYLGIACANLVNLLNLELIVLGGGVMASGEMLLRPALEEAQRHSMPPPFEDCRIIQSDLWPEAGVIGAALLAGDR